MQAMRMKLSVLSVVFGLVSMAVPAAAQQCTWSALGSGVRGDVNAMRGFDTGSGPILYTGGSFLAAGGVGALNLARWDGTQWLPTCYGATSQVLATLIFDDGTGPALYVAGIFDNIQGVPANGIAKWDGKQWSALGLGLQFPDGSAGRVNALAGFDDGTGPALYVGGRFSIAGGAPANFIAKWDGKRWSPLGSGMDRPDVNALLVFDDGTGPALYAGGEFLQAGGVAANKMARWNGTQWSAVGLGMNEFVYDLALFDDGSGLALYACGPFTFAGGMAANRIAKWNGTQWSALGSGLANNNTHKLVVFDDGTGPALYVGGTFTIAGGMPANKLAKWNGTQWSAVGSGVDNTVFSLAVFDDGIGPALYVGGRFTVAGGIPARDIVKYRCTAP